MDYHATLATDPISGMPPGGGHRLIVQAKDPNTKIALRLGGRLLEVLDADSKKDALFYSLAASGDIAGKIKAHIGLLASDPEAVTQHKIVAYTFELRGELFFSEYGDDRMRFRASIYDMLAMIEGQHANA
jgi:hypothetical protein